VSRARIFAGNWKMHLGPDSARQFMHVFLQRYRKQTDRGVWFFPPALSLETVSAAVRDRGDLLAGAQNVHWEGKGAFTGEISVGMAKEAGARAALVGHSERRHVFGETDDETGTKVRAVLAGDLTPVLCVGEKLAEREAGNTVAVVERQLGAVAGLDAPSLGRIVIAYEPVWAIGTGKNATPADAAEVHRAIRNWFRAHGVRGDDQTILYGGSVNPGNAASLLAESEIDGVRVGGASLDPAGWAQIAQT
jgi:triosephosphate isomerase